jgi:2'-5' RNA ligase
VVWVGTIRGAEQLGALEARLTESTARLGVEREHRAYKAHLTIARAKHPCDVRALLADVPHSATTMQIGAFTLFRSHLGGQGPRYEIVQRFALESRRA